jgi:hypothetical protein
MRQAAFDGYYEEVEIIPGRTRCESGALMSVGPGLAAADFGELRNDELRRMPKRRSSQNANKAKLGVCGGRVPTLSK